MGTTGAAATVPEGIVKLAEGPGPKWQGPRQRAWLEVGNGGERKRRKPVTVERRVYRRWCQAMRRPWRVRKGSTRWMVPQ
jgi:hypothetical protein